MVAGIKDPFSALSHLAGIILGLLTAVPLLIRASAHGPIGTLSALLFIFSLLALYTASTLYHWLNLEPGPTGTLRKLDHIMIFVLIAGSYSPVCLSGLQTPLGTGLFILVWSIALLGFIIKLFWIQAPRLLSTALYLGAGWLAAVLIIPLALDPKFHQVLFWMLAGGLFYTAGGIIYAVKKPNPLPGRFGFHEIFHLFVLAGSAAHIKMAWSVY